MIRIIGDTHGDMGCFTDAYMPGQSGWGAGDKLIITGDFGFVMRGEENDAAEKERLDTLARKPYEILFVDGNHEGFDYLEQYPEELRYGAPVRRIRDNIFWLQRGYIYTIEGKTFFCMGGAYSVDQASKRLEKKWFKQELPTPEEYHRAGESLKKAGMKVDYVLTHTAPKSLIKQLIDEEPDPHDADLTGTLDWIYYDVDFKKWFFGHFHEDRVLRERMVACLKKLHEIP